MRYATRRIADISDLRRSMPVGLMAALRHIVASETIAVSAIVILSCTGCNAVSRTAHQDEAKTPRFTQVAAGQDHTCALTADGNVFCWGSNQSGQLGIGNSDDAAHSEPVRLPASVRLRSITAGYRHTCGLDTSGRAYCWGANDSGQLGNGSLADSSTPARVTGGLEFASLSAGGTHTCGITTSKTTVCWGGNWHGQLGIGSKDGERDHPCCFTEPLQVTGGLSFSQVSAGGIHTCGLTPVGKAYCWGAGTSGRLGNGSGTGDKTVPSAVSGDMTFSAIRARGFFTCAINAAQNAYCWGAGANGQLGTGSSLIPEVATPTAVKGSLRFTTIELGNNHACGMTPEGKIYCWGSNRFGQLGNDGTENQSAPVEISSQLRFQMLSTGGNDFSGHTCAIDVGGRIVCWGDGRHGQLGNGSITGSAKPLLVTMRK